MRQYLLAKNFYRLTTSSFLWLLVGSLSCLCLGLTWGLGFAPHDAWQADGFRIMYVHVPVAFLSLGGYVFLGVMSLCYSIWRIKLCDYLAAASAPIGAAYTALALITGSLWGKPMWGTWWVWDARLTAELVLLWLYLGYLALRHTLPEATAGRAAALLAILGLLDIPVVHYSVHWWHTLHQGASLTVWGSVSIAWPMLWPLLCCLLGFILLYVLQVLSETRRYILRQEQTQAWVQALLHNASKGEGDERR
jgi:heme exporter protein C